MTIYSSVSYLQKQRFLPRQIQTPPPAGLDMVIVIPCFAETDLLRTLESLEACEAPTSSVEVIIVLNHGAHHGEDIRQINHQTRKDFLKWNTGKRLRYFLIEATELPKKHAGVGLARKIGMDEAVDRLEQAGTANGLIVNLDADSQVAENYLTEIAKLAADRRHDAWSVHFEHPLAGEEFPQEVYQGIVLYELFLRYYIEGLRYAGYPMAFHTIGSSMVVRAKAYQAEGGMNRRKAGEDFYFLHKFSQLGRLGECNTTTVIPSPRPSWKVPFGTGKAIQGFLDRADGSWMTYPPAVFDQVKQLVDAVPTFADSWPTLPALVNRFLEEEGLPERLPDIRQHASTPETFLIRFFAWLDPLKILRLIHFLRDEESGEIPLPEAADRLWRMLGNTPLATETDLLLAFRQRQRER